MLSNIGSILVSSILIISLLIIYNSYLDIKTNDRLIKNSIYYTLIIKLVKSNKLVILPKKNNATKKANHIIDIGVISIL